MADEPWNLPPPQYNPKDFELASRLHKGLPRRPLGDDLEIDLKSIPHSARVVIQVWTADGIIGNGGLKYLFESDFADGTPYAEFADSYDEVGASDCAAALRWALTLFPDGKPPSDPEEREAALGALYGTFDNQGPMQKGESVFFDMMDRNVGLVADYIREHWDELAPYVDGAASTE